MWGHLTGGSDGGPSVTWPTPVAQEPGNTKKTYGKDNKKRGGFGLSQTVKMWPTPAANPPGWKNIEVVDKDGNYPTHTNQRFYDKKTGRLVQKGLEQAVRWPTPRANSAMASTITPEVAWNQNRRRNLETEVGRRTWPTPDTQNHREGSKLRKDNNINQGGSHGVSLHHAVYQENNGLLNCNWVEALMGYPQNWTSLDDGETDPGRKESPE